MGYTGTFLAHINVFEEIHLRRGLLEISINILLGQGGKLALVALLTLSSLLGFTNPLKPPITFRLSSVTDQYETLLVCPSAAIPLIAGTDLPNRMLLPL